MSVGAALTRAREERGLAVEDVSAATRIRAGLIRSIEADEFDGCGGAVYARGHIRSIARVVGADADELVAEFDRAHADEAPPPLVPTPATDPVAVAHADRKRPNWAAAMAVVLVAVCVLAGISLIGNSHPSKSAARDVPVLTRTPQPQQSSPAPAPAPKKSFVAQLPTNQAVALVRVTSSRTWMSVTTMSGRLLFQGLLSAGERKVFRDAKGLQLIIGNAPVVDLVANGQDIGTPKSQGNVARVTIARGGSVQYA
ncbi:MAG TPA: RodZ domain-containing protein [Mycobacteriales bacterium]|nr:RodZ domain-containing protein [Mycobacteriales bacterium]